MLVHIRRSAVLAVVALVLTFAYALAGVGVSQLFFKHQANGSLTANGSTLIGQNWSHTKCPGHPLAAACSRAVPTPSGPTRVVEAGAGGDTRSRRRQPPVCPTLNSGSSGATNLGPRSKVLKTNTEALVAYWNARGVNPTPDLVTTSGSGYDPDITAADALAEIPMVSKATGIAPATLGH